MAECDALCSFQEECAVRVSMFTSCGGVGQAGVAAVRRTLQLYKSLMRPSSLKNALKEQHRSCPCLRPPACSTQPPPLPPPPSSCSRCEMHAISQRIEQGEALQLMMMWTSKRASNL